MYFIFNFTDSLFSIFWMDPVGVVQYNKQHFLV